MYYSRRDLMSHLMLKNRGRFYQVFSSRKHGGSTVVTSRALDEYMSKAWISVGVPICFVHVHLFDTSLLVEKQLQYLETNPDILKWSSIIVRLCDDLGTSPAEMMRGDTPKAIQCYMNDTGALEDVAREHVKT
ncbi:unnamed protein product [Rhodiola kirilowii]